MSRYRWVHYETGKLFSVGIQSDGTLFNPNGYPEDVFRRHHRRGRRLQWRSDQ
jgi:hypothetical protein